jgi:hypothetical protein
MYVHTPPQDQFIIIIFLPSLFFGWLARDWRLIPHSPGLIETRASGM